MATQSTSAHDLLLLKTATTNAFQVRASIDLCLPAVPLSGLSDTCHAEMRHLYGQVKATGATNVQNGLSVSSGATTITGDYTVTGNMVVRTC